MKLTVSSGLVDMVRLREWLIDNVGPATSSPSIGKTFTGSTPPYVVFHVDQYGKGWHLHRADGDTSYVEIGDNIMSAEEWNIFASTWSSTCD